MLKNIKWQKEHLDEPNLTKNSYFSNNCEQKYEVNYYNMYYVYIISNYIRS